MELDVVACVAPLPPLIIIIVACNFLCAHLTHSVIGCILCKRTFIHLINNFNLIVRITIHVNEHNGRGTEVMAPYAVRIYFRFQLNLT